MSLHYEPMSKAHWADPYPVYRELRETAPVYRAPESGLYCVSRYEDVAFALRSAQLFSSKGMEKMLFGRLNQRPTMREAIAMARFMVRARAIPFLTRRPRGLVTEDAPRHDAMRAVVNRGFTPSRISEREARMREIVEGRMAKLSSGAGFDVIHDLAIPLPVTVTAEMLVVEPQRH